MAEKKPKKPRQTEYDRWVKLGLLQDKLFIMQSMAMSGNSNAEISDALGISESTLKSFKSKYEDVYTVLSKSKTLANYKVMNSLFKKCTDGDVSAIKFWLTNKWPEEWKEKADVNHNLSGKVFVIDDTLGEDYEDGSN